MKFFAVILLTLLVPLSLFAQTTDVMTVAVAPKKANLRGTASVTGKVVIEVVQGEVFDVLLKQGEWFLVQTPIFVGWLHQNVVTPESYLPDLSDIAIKPQPQRTVETSSEPTYLSDSEDNGYDVGLVRSQTADLVDAQEKFLMRIGVVA